MSTSAAPIAPTGPITTYSPPTTGNAYGNAPASSSTLTQNDFLNLLSTQLQNQDPTNPISNTDFAAQMAQFSSLTEMSNMNTTMSNMSSMQQLTSGAGLIGATVTTDLTNSAGSPLGGQVTAATVSNGALTVTVGGQQVSLSNITGIA